MNEGTEPVDGPKLTGHLYDGIQEYDNPLPGWWSWLFIGTIVYSILYQALMWMHPDTLSVSARYQSSVTRMLQQQFAQLGELEPDEATLLGFVQDPEQQKWLEVGRAVFLTNCASCHGRDGAGVSAPNMTDDFYKNVKTVADIVTVVRNGANNAAMPAWGQRLQSNEIVLVAAYVASLRGQALPRGWSLELGAPYGTQIPAWPAR
jgi:cytochrome c oxidase cbb3-type subunit 3